MRFWRRTKAWERTASTFNGWKNRCPERNIDLDLFFTSRDTIVGLRYPVKKNAPVRRIQVKRLLLSIIASLVFAGCASFKDYSIGTIKVRVHEAELSEDRKRVPWTGYGVDGGFPKTVVSALEITDASGTYSLPADMVDDLGNPSGHGHVRLNEKLLELSMSNSDGAGWHQVLFQVDLAKARACRFVRVVIEDDFTKTHDWTKIKNHKN